MLKQAWLLLLNNIKSTKQTDDFEYINTKCMTTCSIFCEQRELEGKKEDWLDLVRNTEIEIIYIIAGPIPLIPAKMHKIKFKYDSGETR